MKNITDKKATGVTEGDIRVMQATAREAYPSLWRDMISDWLGNDRLDAAWLTYSANYILRTAGYRWAVDPFSLFTRIGNGNQPDFREDLKSVQLIVLTHEHNDHLDLDLIRTLCDLPITWVIPNFLLDGHLQDIGIPKNNICVPHPGIALQFPGLTLTPFFGLHFRGSHGVPAMGYLAEFSGKRWLFPGDTRTYDPKGIPDHSPLDGIFAHLWLGRKSALLDEPPLLGDFVDFFSHFQTKRLVITHLEELGRKADDLWTWAHYLRVAESMRIQSPGVSVESAKMGQKVIL